MLKQTGATGSNPGKDASLIGGSMKESRNHPPRHQDSREDQDVSVMGQHNVLLHLRRLFWALSAWRAASDAARKNGPARTRNARSFVGNFPHDGGPKRDDLPIAGAKAT